MSESTKEALDAFYDAAIAWFRTHPGADGMSDVIVALARVEAARKRMRNP